MIFPSVVLPTPTYFIPLSVYLSIYLSIFYSRILLLSRHFYRSRPREAASRATPRERLPPDLSAPSGRVIGIQSGSKALASALHLDDARALRQ